MFRSVRSLLANGLLVFLAFAPAAARSQYMYLDANGDGVHTDADVIAPGGGTTFDVWLITDRNRNGTDAICPVSGRSFTINSFAVLLQTRAGRVAWGTFSNRGDQFSMVQFEASGDQRFYAAGLVDRTLPPGRYRLGSLTVTPSSGTPSVEFLGAMFVYPRFRALGMSKSGCGIPARAIAREGPSSRARIHPSRRPADRIPGSCESGSS